MNRVIDATAASEQFALGDTLGAVPDAEFEVLRVAATGETSSMPLLRATAPDVDAVREHLRSDDSITTVRTLHEDDTELLFEVEWAGDARLPVYAVPEREATLLSAFGTDGTWYLRLLFPDPGDVESTSDFLERYDLDVRVRSVRRIADSTARGHYGLAERQFETLSRTHGAGYFDIPREDSLQDLSEEFEISHQALSERIRRALGTLVENTVATPGPKGSSY